MAPSRTILSDRECEILTLISRGYTSAQIGRKLYLSTETVRTHARNILGTLGARSRAHAVALGLREGVIAFPGPERSVSRAERRGDA